MLLFSGSQILCRYIYNTVGINIKCNFDLRDTSSCRRNSIQTELTKCLVVSCKLTLALYHMDINCRLIVSCCREDLALLSRDRCISLDQSGCYAAHSLNRQRQRSYVQKKDISCSCIACQLAALDSCADGYALIWIQRFAWFLSCNLLYLILCGDHTGRTAY